MADINLNFGSEDLNKLEQILKEIQKAAKNLTDTLKKTGTVLDKDYKLSKQMATSTKKLATEKKKLTAVEREQVRQERALETIKAKTLLIHSKTNQEVIKQQAAYRKLTTEIRNGGKATNLWSKALGSFQFKFNALGNIASNVVSRITRELKQAVSETVKMAAEFQGIEAAFKKINNYVKVLEDLKNSTRGTVSEMSLMQNALRAQNFKIPMDVLAKGLEFATKRAAQTGESVDYLVNSFVVGLGRQSVKILDNLGISVLEIHKEVKKTGDFMTAFGNIMDRELTNMGFVILTDAQKMDMFKASIENAKVGLGQLILGGFSPLINVGNKLFEAIDNQSIALAKEQTQLNALVGAATSANISEKARLKTIEDLQKLYPDFLKNVDAEKISNSQLTTELEKVNTLYVERIKLAVLQKVLADEEEKLYKVIAREAKLQYELSEATNKLVETKAKLEAAYKSGNMDVYNYVNTITILEDEIGKLETQLGRGTWKQAEYQSAVDRVTAAVNAQLEAVKALGSGSGGSGAVVALEDISKLVANLKDEGEFTEEDQAAFYWGSEFWDAIIATSEEKMAEMSELLEKQRTEEFDKADAARRRELEAINAAEALKQSKIQDTFEIASQAVESFSNIFEATKNKELSMVGDNEAKREAIEKKYAKREQRMAIARSIIYGAEAIQKTHQKYGLTPFGIAAMLASAALTATEIGIIRSQKFAKGDIDINGPSHAHGGIAAEIEGGESVINKRSTSKYKDLLRAINEDDQMRIMDAMGRDRKINVNGASDPFTRKMYELMKNQHNYGQDNSFYYKQVGNTLYKVRK